MNIECSYVKPEMAILNDKYKTHSGSLMWLFTVADSMDSSVSDESYGSGPMILHKARAVAVPTSICVGENILSGDCRIMRDSRDRLERHKMKKSID